MKTMKCSGALLCLFLLLSPLLQAQQLKLGTAPNLIEKSALLDLNSDKQGLLLPRVSNYTTAPLSTAPDGMLIYYVPDKLLYVRKNGVWRKLIDETNAITSVNGQTTSIVNLTTNNITESVNLYYTDARARSAFSAGTGINLSGAGVISALNTTALWNASQLRGRNISTNTPANNDVLTWDNATSTWLPKAATGGGGTGTVTSVGLSLPSIFNVTNSPVTTSGTLTGTLANQSQRLVFASPVYSSAAPSFRALDALDIPNIGADKITSGILAPAVGGTGLNYLGGANTMLRVNAAGTGLEYSNDYVGLSSNINMGGDVSGSGNFYYINTTLASVGTAGTYTKVTTDAKGRVTYGTTLASGDIPNLDMSKITTGILPLSMGGTGLNYAGAVGQSIRINTAGNGFEYYTPGASATTLTGDVTGSGSGSFATTLANVGTAGTYTKVTTDAKGRVISGTSLAAADLPAGSANYIQNISSGTQTANYAITGNGSIGGNLSLPSLTTGSVPFIGTGGLVSQNNANFFWDNTNYRLGLGTATPNNTLEVAGTIAATGVSGLRLKDLNTATVQTYNSKVLSIDGSGNVIVTNNAAASNWLVTGNTGNAATAFLGNTDDKAMVIKSNNTSFLEFGRRQTLGLYQNVTDYTNNDEKVTYIRSALQFETPATVTAWRPKMWVNTDGNFRMKGSAANNDYFEFGGTGTNDNGGFEFVIGDNNDEPFIFKSYYYVTAATTEMMRIQGGKVGINMAGATPARELTVNGNLRFTGSVGISDRLLGRNNTDGDVATIGVGTTLTMSSNVLDANAASALWNANKIQGVTVSSTAPATGQVLTYDGTNWAPATVTNSSTGANPATSVGNGTNNNINIGSSSFIRISTPTAAFTINGFVPATYADGQVIVVYNATAQNMTIANNGTGAAASRILTLTGANIVTTGAGAVTMIYSTADSKWIVTSYNL